jgi:hypothetical protein
MPHPQTIYSLHFIISTFSKTFEISHVKQKLKARTARLLKQLSTYIKSKSDNSFKYDNHSVIIV